MNSRFLYLLLFILPCAAQASCYTTEFRVGYFYPQSSLLRDIYYNGGVEFEFESTVLLSRTMDIWANVNYFQQEGRSLGLGDKTNIQLLPLSFGFKYLYAFTNYWNVYIGVGGSYTWARFHDESPYVEQHTRKQAFGWVVKSGFIYYFYSQLFLDLFADYYSTQISGVHRNGVQGTGAQIGGLRTGLGLGISY